MDASRSAAAHVISAHSPHGGAFLPWIDAEFGMKPTLASHFMNVANTYGDKLSIVENINPTALYELAAPSTPEPVRQQIEALHPPYRSKCSKRSRPHPRFRI